MFLSLSLFLAFKEKKEQILFQMNFLKMSNNIFLCADFSPLLGILGVFCKSLWSPVPSEKATNQSTILDLGSHNSLL